MDVVGIGPEMESLIDWILESCEDR
jgi:hypothetical protein